MKRILAMLLSLTLICTTIIVPAVNVSAEETQAAYEDFVTPDTMPANIYVKDDGLTGRWLATFNARHPSHSGGIEGVMRYDIVAAPQYWGDTSTSGVAGGDMSLCIGSYKWKADTTYIFQTELRNNDTSSVTTSRFGYMIDSRDGTTTNKPYEILTITSKEWQQFTFKLHVDVDGSTKSGLYYGYPNHSSLHNPQGTDILFKIGSMYIMEEVGYSIGLEATETTMAENGAPITFTSKIYNQLDEEMTDIKEKSEWYVVNEDRTAKVDGFEITVSDDGMSAEVSAPKGMAGGKYVLITENDSVGQENFRKGIEFTVVPRYAADSGSMEMRAKLSRDDAQWTTDKISTGLVDSILVEATLSGNTEAFDWYVVDADRESIVEGLDVTVSRDGEKETATVAPTPSFAEGDYYIIAEAKDGSLKGQPINIDKAADILAIKNTFTSGNASDIKAGLEGIYLFILEIPDGFAAKADADALSKIIATAAEEEKIADAELSELKEIVERLALVSMYNVSVEGVELTDENGGFKYADRLKLSDADGITINSVFNAKATDAAKTKVMAAVTGKDYTTWSEFADDANEAMLLNTLAYPNVNGIEYVAELLTKENLAAVGIDATAYLALEDREAFNDSIANELYTIEKLKEIIEEAEDEDDDDGKGSSGSTGSSGGGGGSFKVSETKDDTEEKEEDDGIVPETYSFSDVPESHWAYADIHYLKSLGVINGIDENTFAPNANVTREQFLKIIIEAFGIEMKNTSKTFGDVKADAWYAPYVAAGVENGIINGVDADTFGTGKPVTRQDACTIIARALNLEDATEGDLSFTDAESISSYARAAVSALSGYAVINGMGDGSFAPDAVCTRAQAAKIVSATIGIVNALSAANGR